MKALPRPDEQKLLQLAIDDAKDSVAKAESVVARLQPLLERKEISEQQMFEAKLALHQARVQQQKAQVTLTVAMFGARTEAVDEAAARITAAAAVEASTKGQLDLLTIRSPIDGVLDKITCRLGQSLTMGTPIGEVVDPRQLSTLVWLPTSDAALVQAGQPAQVTPDDAGANKTESDSFAGTVDFVGQVVDPQTGNVPIRVLVENPPALGTPGGRLRLGQTVTVAITVAKRSKVLAVPAEAITDLAEGPLLSVVRDGKAVLKYPQLGLKDHGWVEPDLLRRHPGGRTRGGRGELQPARRNSRHPQAGGQVMSLPSPAESGHVPTGRSVLALARPYFGLIVVVTILLTLAGAYSMLHMPSGIYPEVAFPRIVVIVQTPGLAVKDVEVGVSRPIEEAVNVVLGVQRVQTRSVRGAAEVRIDFVPGSDMVQALNDVRAKMADVSAQLPAGTSTIVERQTPSVFPIISFAVTGGRDASALRDYAYYDLRPRISHILDVSYVTVQGGDVREIVVEIDPQKVVAAGLSLVDVADRLGKEHRMKAVGRIDQETRQFQVLTNTVVADPKELEERVVAQKNGQAIRVRNLGRVIVTHEDRTMAIRANGTDAVVLTVFRRLGGNALTVSSEAQQGPGRRRPVGPAGHPHRARLRPGPAGPHRHRQRPRRDPGRRAVQRADPLDVPEERPRHAAGGALHPLEPGDQLPLSPPHRRHAEPDVAGRPGRGHRPDHRRLRGGRGEHRPAPFRRADGRRGDRPRQPRDLRGGDRLDADDDPGLRAAGLRAGRDRAVLPVVEPGADRGLAGLDGHQPDAGAGAGGAVPGAAANAAQRADLQRPGQQL